MRWARARLRPCDITQRTTKLKLRGSDNCRHYTNHGSHTCRPTELALARSREEEVGNRRKRVSSERERAGWDGVKAAADHRIAADRRPIRNIRFSRCACPYLRMRSDDGHRGDFDLGASLFELLEASPRHGERGEEECSPANADIFIRFEMSADRERTALREVTYGSAQHSTSRGGEKFPSILRLSSIRIVRGRGGKLNERR